MEDEYTLVRSPFIDKTKWIEKLKYDILRVSLYSVDFNLVEVGNAVNIQVKRLLILTYSPYISLSFFRPHLFDYVCVICIQYLVTKV
jgi:hypothetical protein